jgi:hypothetical protein
MSRTYSSWRSFKFPDSRSSSTSENPITAFKGVRSSCDIDARNSDLCADAISSARAVMTFWIAITPCVAKPSTERDRAVVERRDHLAPQHDHAEHAILGQHRHAEHRVEAAELERPRHRVPRVRGGVDDLHRPPLREHQVDHAAEPAAERHAVMYSR